MSSHFPDKGILWRIWNDDTRSEIAQRRFPVLLFVLDRRPAIWLQLKQIFEGMPGNVGMRELLRRDYPAVVVEASDIPEELAVLGAGSQFHIAVLSPYGLTPMVVIDPTLGTSAEIIDEIVLILEQMKNVWRP